MEISDTSENMDAGTVRSENGQVEGGQAEGRHFEAPHSEIPESEAPHSETPYSEARHSETRHSEAGHLEAGHLEAGHSETEHGETAPRGAEEQHGDHAESADADRDVEQTPSRGSDADVDADAKEDEGPFSHVPDVLKGALTKRGFTKLSAVQSAVLEGDARGRDLQISSQTGSGKTVALGIVLGRSLATPDEPVDVDSIVGPEALVIVPTRELAAQVCDELRWLFADLPSTLVASVTGGTPIFRDKATFARAPRVLVGTPGRLVDHLTNGNLDLGSVRELVLDEADQMLDMGFREDLEKILDATAPNRRTHLVSATFPDGIQRLAQRYQENPVSIEGTRLGDANQDIEHVGFLVNGEDRYAALVNMLLLGDGAKTLVFVERRMDTMELATRLERDGFKALPISGDLAQQQRDRTLVAFKDGRANILVATDVAARGLDVADVTLVVQTSPPIDPEIYTHRSGRTGRAGNQGRSVIFAPPRRRRHVERLLADAGVDVHWKEVPSAEEVQSHVDKRERADVESKLDAALAGDLHPKLLAHAKAILESRDPEQVVAALLSRLSAGPRAKASDVETMGSGQGQGRPGQGGDIRVSHLGKVRFFTNYGANQGATPGRVVASMCRRGGIDGQQISSIAIHPNATTFDIDAAAAEQFEDRVSRRDPRDTNTFVRRDRGPNAGGGGGLRGGGRRRGGGARREGAFGFARRRGGRGSARRR